MVAVEQVIEQAGSLMRLTPTSFVAGDFLYTRTGTEKPGEEMEALL